MSIVNTNIDTFDEYIMEKIQGVVQIYGGGDQRHNSDNWHVSLFAM